MGKYKMEDCTKRLETVLDRTGYMTVQQAAKINYCNPISFPAVKVLVEGGRAFLTQDRKYVLRQPWRKPYAPVIDAIDVMIPFLSQNEGVDLNSIFVKPYRPKHYNTLELEDDEIEDILDMYGTKMPEARDEAAEGPDKSNEDETGPLLLGFAKANKIYEVYSASGKEELDRLSGFLHHRFKKHIEEENGKRDDIRYLIMIKYEEMLMMEPDRPDYPYAYVLLEGDDESRCVTYYNPDAYYSSYDEDDWDGSYPEDGSDYA